MNLYASHAAAPDRPGLLNASLVVLFLLGIYVGIDVQAAPGLPVPVVVAGAAGLTLLVVNGNRIEPAHVGALSLVIVLFLASILFAADYAILKERFKGLVQISYSLIIGYGFFIGALRFGRDRLAWVLLILCTLIVLGCALENYTGFRALSDAFRVKVFSFGVYISDIRDQFLYGRIRPKLFTSEPSIVTFCFTLFMFAWYVLSRWRLKLLIYLAYLAAGLFLMRGPTLLIGVALIVPYQLLLAARSDGPTGTTYDARRVLATLFLALVVAALVGVLTVEIYSERLDQILSGRDPSFYARIIAPALAAFEMISRHPVAGAGLTGWEFIDPVVRRIYSGTGWDFRTPAEAITNYFWSHWIFLGLLWGTIMIVALSRYLGALGVSAVLFTWIVWIGFGNSLGSYVGPRTWTVFFLAAVIVVLHQRQPIGAGYYPFQAQPRYVPFPAPSYQPQ